MVSWLIVQLVMKPFFCGRVKIALLFQFPNILIPLLLSKGLPEDGSVFDKDKTYGQGMFYVLYNSFVSESLPLMSNVICFYSEH